MLGDTTLVKQHARDRHGDCAIQALPFSPHIFLPFMALLGQPQRETQIRTIKPDFTRRMTSEMLRHRVPVSTEEHQIHL